MATETPDTTTANDNTANNIHAPTTLSSPYVFGPTLRVLLTHPASAKRRRDRENELEFENLF